MGSNNETVWEVTTKQFGFEFQVERDIFTFQKLFCSWQTRSQHFQAVCIRTFFICVD